ncbi:hypothetical protein O9Z70_15770 [Devosia sp. YIM 151766]|uniref:hypothetical protein n=1 Tax=Devosia sp. YIM 151766 TaxID=3017325 RepID=UPI00255CB2CA|nr:hypothetical protein [Devosia sp. YIM 151766]WIY52889.1 hypothetical protein O9Z70_15770 [Devosia sp. YIM 151766]
MIKNSVVALVTAAALAGIAVPAMAEAAPLSPPAPVESETSSFNADYVLYQLQSQGVNASSVEQWGSYVRAFVTEDGRQVMRLFDADTLNPANI